MPGTMKILAQVRGTTSLVSAYFPAVGVRALVYKITVANSDGSTGDFQICIDSNGTTYDATTAIAWNVPCNDGIVIEYEWDKGLPMGGSTAAATAAHIAVMSEGSNDHTFTIVGEEFE